MKNFHLMDKKKEIEMKKYLEKKQKQKTRDDLMQQITELSNKNTSKASKIMKKKIKKKISNKDRFECSSNESNKNEKIEETDNTLEIENNIESHINMPVEILPISQNESFLNKDGNTNNLDKANIKEYILSLKEHFPISKCLNRLENVQNQRMKLDILYNETEIISTIKYSLITIIQGNTGCGKTTQIPQFLFEHGFCSNGIIGITQPRRFSALSISSRINFEMNEQICGYKIKYENNITPDTKIKVMTEGVLFKEIQSDFLLTSYSVIVLDEVHERSSNSDILVGFLSKIVQIRAKQGKLLRLVLMSASLDTSCYESILGECSLIKLSHKPYEVSIFFEDQTAENYIEAAYNKIMAILQSEKLVKTNKKPINGASNIPSTISNDYSASILVFLASKEDIYLLKEKLELSTKNTTVLSLYSGLNKREQSKVYEKYLTRKIILSTNIAETSITIDDIVFVIDCGRVKRKITEQSLVLYKVGFISKSSALQRAGRCGRTAPGVCYRIYNSDKFESFPEQNIPQILQEPFEPIFLQLKSIGINNIFGFSFIDPPSETTIKESILSLQSIDALDNKGNITALGKKMCKYPVSPRLARLLISSLNEDEAIYSKIVIIVSILSCNIEFKKTETTEVYYDSAKSDMLVGLRIFLDYLKSQNKQKFSSSIGISIEAFEEVKKMSSYLMKISNKGTIENAEIVASNADDTICKYLFYCFADQVAVNCGSSYLFKSDEIFISSDSIKTEGFNFVFDHLICGSKRNWAKGITLISSTWFK